MCEREREGERERLCVCVLRLFKKGEERGTLTLNEYILNFIISSFDAYKLYLNINIKIWYLHNISKHQYYKI